MLASLHWQANLCWVREIPTFSIQGDGSPDLAFAFRPALRCLGRHEQLPGSEMPSGTYFARIESAYGAGTEKLILLK